MINKITYPDGSFYTKIEGTFAANFTFRINSFADLWQLNQIIDVYAHNNVRPTITIPCLFTAQEDRRFNSNESFGLKLVLKFLNDLEANFKIFHPHNEEVICMATDNIEIIDNSEYIKEVFKQIRTETFSQDTILLSPDAGMYKNLMKLADKLKWRGEIYAASKSRKYENGESKLTQVIDRQNFEGKSIILIDDLMIGGGTFIGLAKMLRERNVGKLYLAVSHITVEKPNPELFTLFDKVFTTNSKYEEYFPIPQKDGGGASKAENLEVIKLF